jgi:hypothetical protein
MTYDIEFVIPVSGKPKYWKRLTDFKQVGLLNIKKHKVLVTLLTGTEPVPEVDKN